MKKMVNIIILVVVMILIFLIIQKKDIIRILRDETLNTFVSPELQSSLVRQNSVTQTAVTEATANFKKCELIRIKSRDLKDLFVKGGLGMTQEELDQEVLVFRIPGSSSTPPLAVTVKRTAESKGPVMSIWEISDKIGINLVKERDVNLDPKQDSWYSFGPYQVFCLPEGKVLMGIKYSNPSTRNLLYLYEPKDNKFERIDIVEPVRIMKQDFAFKAFETLIVSPDEVLVYYNTDEIRINDDLYAYKYNHVLLFSPKYPEGIEILKLSIDDGNIEAWGVIDKILWLQTNDKRKGSQEYNWSLDLSKVI